MICSGCKTDNLSARRFCSDCGKSLTKNCPRCDFANGLADRYCGGCGEALLLTVRAPLRSTSTPRPGGPPTLAPALSPASSPFSGGSEELPPITPHELSELMRRKPALVSASPALSAKVSQCDLDKLFGTLA